MVLLINQDSGSDGDMISYVFRQMALGKLVWGMCPGMCVDVCIRRVVGSPFTRRAESFWGGRNEDVSAITEIPIVRGSAWHRGYLEPSPSANALAESHRTHL